MTSNLEQSKRLYELGVREPSEKIWSFFSGKSEIRHNTSENRLLSEDDYPAFSAGELLRMLPINIEVFHWLSMNDGQGKIRWEYAHSGTSKALIFAQEDSHEEALADLLIKLIESNLIEL